MKAYITEWARLPSTGRKIWLTVEAESLEACPETREFALYLVAAAKSANTIRAYVRSVTRFLNWAYDWGVDWKTVTLAQMGRFKRTIEGEPVRTQSGLRSGKTVNALMTGVLEFLRYCARAEIIDQDVPKRFVEHRWLIYLPHGFDPGESGALRAQRAPLLKARETSRPLDVLTEDQLTTVFSHCRTARDAFQLTLLLDTGVRIGEALGLRRGDMHMLPDSMVLGCDIKGAHIHVRPRHDNRNEAFVKSGVHRHVPVRASTVQSYVKYQTEKNRVPEAVDSDYVFVNLFAGERGRPMTYGATKKVFDRIERASGFPFRPHMLRHTAATRWLHEGGATPDTVQALLGHRSGASTSVYLHPSEEVMRAAVDSVAESFVQSHRSNS